jgi:hypothetical protein
MLDYLSFKNNLWGNLGYQMVLHLFKAVRPPDVLVPSFFPFLTTPPLWSRFSLFQQKKEKAGVRFPKHRKRASVCRRMAVLGLSPKMKIDFNALQHELMRSHGNRIGN